MLFMHSGAGAAGWPQWLGPNRDGISTERSSGTFLSTPRLLWKDSVGIGVSSIVVSNGRAFTIGHVRGSKKRGTDTVYCLDADTGSLIWKYSYNCLSYQTQDVRFYGPRSTPTVDGDTVFTLSLEGHLFCFEASSGEVIWSKELPRDLKGRIPVYGYCCSPLIYGRMLILELNAEEAAYVALDKTNGRVIWQLGGGHVTCGSPVITNIDGSDCVVFMGGGAVVGVNAATGTQLWRHRTWGHAWMGPVVSGNKIFVANASLPRGCGVIRIDDGRPTVIWEDKKRFQTLHCNSVIRKGHIFGFDNTRTDYQGKDSKKSSLKCIDLDTGEVKWVKEKMGWGNLIIFDDKLIILRETGELVIAKASHEGYEEFSRMNVFGGQSWTVPAVTEGKLYCRNNSGDVVCLQLLSTDGEQFVAERATQERDKLGGKQQVSERVSVDDGITSEPTVSTSVFGMQQKWPRFRGPGGVGISHFADIPASWDTKTGEGILWKAAIPLPGQSSPVIWGKRVFLSGAKKERREVYCFDADTGRLVWRKTIEVRSTHTVAEVENDILFAVATPVTDGRYVYAVFGNGDITCLDFEGEIIWVRNLGMPENDYGHCASLEMWRNLLLVQLDQAFTEDGKSRLLALEAVSGRSVWETSRQVPCSWSSPIVIDVAQRQQIITCGDPWVIAYEPATGTEIWRAECLGGEVVSSPVYINGLVFAVSVDGVLAAIRPNGKGDVTKTHIVWSAEEGLPSICSPVTDGRLLWLVDSGGLVTCYDVKDGTKVWEKELETSFQASPSLVNDLLYLLSDQGVLYILRAASRYELVRRLEVGEQCQASPAFQTGRMYIRAKDHLYCFGDTVQ